MRRTTSLVVVGVALTLSACGGGGDDTAGTDPESRGDSGPVTTTVEATATTQPVDYQTALAGRLGEEWGDEALADEIVAAMSPETLVAWEDRVPADAVATDPLLTYGPTEVDASEIDALLVFTFGYRGLETDRDPGPVNQAMADAVEQFVADHPVPVYAQTTVAQLLTNAGVPDVTSLDQEVGSDGEVRYLSTAGAAEQAVAKAGETETPLGTVGVVCMADHLGRCILTADATGLDAVVPAGVDLPTDYDPESTQPWTRDRASFLAIDLAGRLALPA